jgi:serine phosphatase RsbU (regulator of sigma subunit)
MSYSDTSSQELFFLYYLAQVLASTIDMDEITEYVIDGTCALLGAEQGFLYFLDSDNMLRLHDARGLEKQDLRRLASDYLPLLQGGQPVAMPHPSGSEGTVLGTPLISHEEVHGLVGVATGYERDWTPQEHERLTAVSNLASLALENARLYQRVQKDLALGRKIQQSFLPLSCPPIPQSDVVGISRPALQVGGDFYDFISLSNDRLGLIVADVSEKGVSAALFMALTRSLMRVYGRRQESPNKVIQYVNEFLCTESGTATMFVTLFYGIWDPAAGILRYVNAGHNPPYLRRRDGSVEEFPLGGGLPLGVLPGQDWPEREVALYSGDVFVGYSDGLTEAMNDRRECFGEDRLCDLLRQPLPESAQEIQDLLVREVDRFADGEPQFDDLTLLILKYGASS